MKFLFFIFQMSIYFFVMVFIVGFFMAFVNDSTIAQNLHHVFTSGWAVFVVIWALCSAYVAYENVYPN